MKQELINKYNVPVPRYTSYPPANYFTDSFTNDDFVKAVDTSNNEQPEHISIYIHIPFCRHLCFYCGCNSFPMMKPEIVEEYIVAVQKEIEMVTSRLARGRKISQIHYGGGSPTSIPVSYLKAINKQILSTFDCIDNPEIAIECHPGYLDEAYWEELTQAGFNRFSIGVQDMNPEVLKAVNRRSTLLPLQTIFGILKSAGASINLDFIYGLPHQSEKSFIQTIQQAINLHPDRIVTFSYAHVPWVNKLQLKLEEAGLPSNSEKSRMYESAAALLNANGYHSIGLDHFVLANDELNIALKEGKLHRNFQGYCTRRTTGQVYAFGVTGISQLASAYAQNTKDIKEYISLINNGEFAIKKGYTLSAEEQITREVITSLMCNCRLDWKELSGQLSLPVETIKAATAYNESKLKEFAADGIIELDENSIRVNAEDTVFVRNVAASLDKLMLNNNKSFSKPV